MVRAAFFPRVTLAAPPIFGKDIAVIPMIDFALTEEQLLIQRTARDFAQREIRPVVEQLDHGGPQVEDSWSLVRPVMQKAAELGFLAFHIPEAFGGSGRSGIDGAIFIEEIAAVDLGIANMMGATMGYPLFILAAGTPDQQRAWLPELCRGGLHVLAGAQSEPNVAGSELFCRDADPRLGMRTYARREGDHYIVNGTKSGFVTNAGIASHYFIVARTALDRPPAESMSLFYIPADLPGFTVGRRTAMLGMHTGHHAELVFDDVRIPADRLLGREGGALDILGAVLGLGLGTQFVGLARGAFHYALAYAKQRRSCGKPLIEHQAIALLLADMEVGIHAARLLNWDALAAAGRMDPLTGIRAMGSKLFAVDVAIRVTQDAVKILGGYGVTREYLAAKYLCDAMMGYACDFTGDMLRLRIAERLRDD